MINALISNTLQNIQESIQQPKAWAWVTALFLFVNQYIFSEWHFAGAFFGIFLIDTIVGTFIAYRLGEFKGIVFREKLMVKSIMYFSIIISFSMATKVTFTDSDTNIIQYLNIPFYSIFITVELKSIIEKWRKYKNWPLLEILAKKLDLK